MSNQNLANNNSIFEVLDNDLFVNFVFDQPQMQAQHSGGGIPRIPSNSQLSMFGHQPSLYQLQTGMQLEPSLFERNLNFSFADYPKEELNDYQPERTPDVAPKQKKSQNSTADEINALKNSELFHYKNNLKNTYINKISSLMNQDIKTNPKTDRSRQKQNLKQNRINPASVSVSVDVKKDLDDELMNPENDNAKLLRNRECARNSRKRKKVYIELLENKVKQLSEQLDKTKRILQTSSTYFSQMTQNSQLQGFFLGRQQLYEKLDKSVQMNKDQNEINLLLDSMRFRVGGGGKERISAANYFYNQILDVCFPIHVRYLLWSSTQNKDLFFEPEAGQPMEEINNPKNWSSWSKDLWSNIQISDTQRRQVQKSKRKLIQEKQKLEDLLTKFQEVKEQIFQKTSQVENFVDELRKILNPIQIAKFLIGLEKNKYRKEMHLSKIWDIFDSSSDGEIDVKEESTSNLIEDPTKRIHL